MTSITRYLMLLATPAMMAAGVDDNIAIVDGSEEYRLIDTGPSMEIKARTTHQYEAQRHAGKLQSWIYYNDRISLDKASGGDAHYRNANPPTVFHDDSKICFIDINLDRKGKKAKTEFRRTFRDPAQFATLFFEEDYPIVSKTVEFKIPPTLSAIELTDCNFPAGAITRTDKPAPDGSRLITYTLSGLPAAKSEKGMPSAMRCRPYIRISGQFPDLDSLYRYHRARLDVDTVIPGVSDLIKEITSGAGDDMEARIAAIYKFVQRNIRYVAFEAGEAGYRPDAPAEVLRKRFGDCKGMALLLATMLRRIGADATIASVGTRRIPFDIAEVPSLAATDHMVCIVKGGDGLLVLDPTNEYISAAHVPYSIQGKDAMVYTATGFEMLRMPSRQAACSTDSAAYTYLFDGDMLHGLVTRDITEDMAEYFMADYDAVPRHHQQDFLVKSLIPLTTAEIDAQSMVFDNETPGRITISAPIRNSSALTEADEAVYIDLNTSGEPFNARVDTDDRTLPFELPLRGRVVRRSSVKIPAGWTVTAIPDSYHDRFGDVDMTCDFAGTGDTVTMTKTIQTDGAMIDAGSIAAWNKALSAWNDACNMQIELKRL